MDFIITREQLEEWCSYPAEKILAMPNLKAEIRCRKSTSDLMEEIGNLMVEELLQNNAKGLPTRWILPTGPLDQYEPLIRRVNAERISMKNVYAFMMDEFLDWQGRPYPVEARYESLRGTLKARLFDRIDPALAIPSDQIFCPDINDIDAYDAKIEEVGGIDTIWAGIGCKGLVGFCEAPHSRYYRIGHEEYKNSKARIVELNEDTLVALSQRNFGGCYDFVPPKAVTLGMKAILSARRIVYMFRMGSWKQTALRVLLFSEPTLEYPVTFTTKYIPERILYCDEMTLDHPRSHKK